MQKDNEDVVMNGNEGRLRVLREIYPNIEEAQEMTEGKNKNGAWKRRVRMKGKNGEKDQGERLEKDCDKSSINRCCQIRTGKRTGEAKGLKFNQSERY